jgi:hypothetical protein
MVLAAKAKELAFWSHWTLKLVDRKLLTLKKHAYQALIMLKI